MNKERELAKNTAIITFGKICTQLVSFFLLPLYTAVLSTEEYGTVDLVITYASLLLPFATFAIEQSLFRFLLDQRNDHKKTDETISTSVAFISIISLIILFICLVFQVTISRFIITLFLFRLISSIWSSLLLQLCRGLGDNVGYTLGSTLTAVTQIVLNVILLVIIPLGPNGMIIAGILGNVVCTLVVAIRCKLLSHLHIKMISLKTLKELTSYSAPLIPNQLSWWALNASDKVIVQFFIGIAGNGLIAVANKFSTFYTQFSLIFNISWTESASLHIKDADASEFFSKTINSVYKLFLSACCGIIVCMPLVFKYLINEQFDKAYGLIPIFMIASLFNAFVSLYGAIYVAFKKTVDIAKTSIYAALINIVTHLVLVNKIGLYAAAFSTMIGYGAMAIYRYFHSRKYITIKLPSTTFVFSILMIIVSVLSYYSKSVIIHILALIVIIMFSITINKEFIMASLRIVVNRINKIKRYFIAKIEAKR